MLVFVVLSWKWNHVASLVLLKWTRISPPSWIIKFSLQPKVLCSSRRCFIQEKQNSVKKNSKIHLIQFLQANNKIRPNKRTQTIEHRERGKGNEEIVESLEVFNALHPTEEKCHQSLFTRIWRFDCFSRIRVIIGQSIRFVSVMLNLQVNEITQTFDISITTSCSCWWEVDEILEEEF